MKQLVIERQLAGKNQRHNVGALEQANQYLNNQLQGLYQHLENNKQALSKSKEKLNKLIASQQLIKKHISELKKDKQAFNKQLQALQQNNINTLKQDNQALNKQLQALQQKLVSSDQALSNDKKESNKVIEKLELVVNKQKSKIKFIGSRFKVLEARILKILKVEQDVAEATDYQNKDQPDSLINMQDQFNTANDHLRQEQFDLAFKGFEKLAKKGYIKAKFNLASLYYAGFGVEKDTVEAYLRYVEIAEQGMAEAQYMLWTMYKAGETLDLDAEKVILWLEDAAKQGHKKAQIGPCKPDCVKSSSKIRHNPLIYPHVGL
ncbi:hypothetical protein [Candidatus Thioglobus sp.]|uniref:hypothetical protein n=1 Tax=Candidatus Thioglobus sp. TaxID=2026721 RepID=UPI003D144A2B